MKTYALVENGVVTNLIVWSGGGSWAPPTGSSAVEVAEGVEVSIGYYHDGSAFLAPPAPAVPAPLPPTAEQALMQRDSLLAVAALRIAPLQDAVDLDVETGDEVAMLTEWKQYRVDLNRIEQQAGFPADIDWPVAPQ